jgi:DNA-binding response OmpR family regulator
MRLLVVEDERNVANALEGGLVAEGFRVDVAADGDTAYWMATEHDYALIILDIMLPGRNGYQVCRDLRADGDDTPILMLTAKDGEYDQAEGLDTGADDYLVKPFSFVVLLAHIRALLRRAGGATAVADDTLVVGDLTLDRSTRRCVRGTHEAVLTPREFALLDTLATNPGQVFSKDHLLSAVWGPEFDGGTNVVEVYVGYLRRKIDAPNMAKRIETVHGHGYRLSP